MYKLNKVSSFFFRGDIPRILRLLFANARLGRLRGVLRIGFYRPTLHAGWLYVVGAGFCFLFSGTEFGTLEGLGFGEILFHGAREPRSHIKSFIIGWADFFWGIFIKIIIGYCQELARLALADT